MKFMGKVVDDNGYKIEIIRPIKDAMLTIGQKVEITVCREQVDLVNLYNNLLDTETQDAILDKFNAAREAISEPVPSTVPSTSPSTTGVTSKKK